MATPKNITKANRDRNTPTELCEDKYTITDPRFDEVDVLSLVSK